MSIERLEQAKRNVERSRARMESTLQALQARLHPKVLASDAWDGMREKGNDLADGAMEAVKRRPATISAAIGVVALFLAREPLKRAMTRLFMGEDQDHGHVVTTRVAPPGPDYDVVSPSRTTPVREGPVREGVS